MIYRKHVRHASRKNFQLDLFTPDDGHFEHYAVATKHDVGPAHAVRLRLRARRPGKDPCRGPVVSMNIGPSENSVRSARIRSTACRSDSPQ
jgi:hypothetical protein